MTYFLNATAKHFLEGGFIFMTDLFFILLWETIHFPSISHNEHRIDKIFLTSV